jgi:hypothetical protein
MQRGPVEGGVQGILREQSQLLAAIADQVGKIGGRSPALESIGETLAAIEMHLRNLARRQDVDSRSESANRRKGAA